MGVDLARQHRVERIGTLTSLGLPRVEFARAHRQVPAGNSLAHALDQQAQFVGLAQQCAALLEQSQPHAIALLTLRADSLRLARIRLACSRASTRL